MIDIHDGASVRNLERIQETGPHGASSSGSGGRGTTLALVVVSGVCIVFAALAFSARKTTTPDAGKKNDPLAGLASNHPTIATVMPGEVTFPTILSDAQHPTAPLAANPAPAPLPTFAEPPPPGDRLPVVPLPAKHTLTGMAVLSKPAKDKLSVLADESVDPVSSGAKLAMPGSEGGYQVQVSSFRTEAEADAFANQLRARGHKAHVQRAEIPTRGTWYRVKIGPFATLGEATRYRAAFEAKEKMPGFVVKSGVDPHNEKLQ